MDGWMGGWMALHLSEAAARFRPTKTEDKSSIKAAPLSLKVPSPSWDERMRRC